MAALPLFPNGPYSNNWHFFAAMAASDVSKVQASGIAPAAIGVPEPASLTLLATGALGLLGYGWRRRRQAA